MTIYSSFSSPSSLYTQVNTNLCHYMTGRQFTTNPLFFCTTCEQKHWQLLVLNCVFKSIYGKPPWKILALISPEERASLFAVQFNKDNVFLKDKDWVDLLAAHYKRWGLPNLRIPQLWQVQLYLLHSSYLCLPVSTLGVLQDTRKWHKHKSSATCWAVSSKFLCLWPIRLMPAFIKLWEAN